MSRHVVTTDLSQPDITEVTGGDHSIYVKWTAADTNITTFTVEYIADGMHIYVATNEMEATLTHVTSGVVNDINVTSILVENLV